MNIRSFAFILPLVCFASLATAQTSSPNRAMSPQEAPSFQRVISELRNTVAYLRRQPHDFLGQRDNVIRQSEEAIASIEKLLAASAPVAAAPARPVAVPPAPTSVAAPAPVKPPAPPVPPVTTGSSISGIGPQTPVNIQGMDLETAMMAVQQNRANLLENQLKEQMATVEGRNQQIAELNKILATMSVLRAKSSDMNAWINLGANRNEARELVLSLTKLGLLPITGMPAIDEQGGSGIYDIQRRWLDTLAQNIKSNIDSLNSSQQMDMLRLQSLSNKRNEAFETMTNFVKKMQDSRGSVIGNMR